MENTVFKGHLIRKIAMSAGFAVLAIGAIVAISIVNAKVIAPNEGFINARLCHVETGNAKNNMGDRLAIEIEQEGIVLAKNEDDCLPLQKSVEHINVFGYHVVEWIHGGSGSGTVYPGSSQTFMGLLDALDERGITYNQEVIDYYKNWATPTSRGKGSESYGSSY